MALQKATTAEPRDPVKTPQMGGPGGIRRPQPVRRPGGLPVPGHGQDRVDSIPAPGGMGPAGGGAASPPRAAAPPPGQTPAQLAFLANWRSRRAGGAGGGAPGVDKPAGGPPEPGQNQALASGPGVYGGEERERFRSMADMYGQMQPQLNMPRTPNPYQSQFISGGGYEGMTLPGRMDQAAIEAALAADPRFATKPLAFNGQSPASGPTLGRGRMANPYTSQLANLSPQQRLLLAQRMAPLLVGGQGAHG